MKIVLLTAALSVVGLAQSRSVKLDWQANPGNPKTGVSYYPYRAAGECGAAGQQFERLTQSPVAALTYTDTTVRPGRKYCYHVRATDGKGESAPSPTAEAVIPVSESK
jgi:hypothetical protein